MEASKQEFINLVQDEPTVAEYEAKFVWFNQYATEMVSQEGDR